MDGAGGQLSNLHPSGRNLLFIQDRLPFCGMFIALSLLERILSICLGNLLRY